MDPDSEKFEIILSVCAQRFIITSFGRYFSKDPMHLPVRARAHGPRARASFSTGMLIAC